MTLHGNTVRRIIRVLRDSGDAAVNVAGSFFDEGGGPHEDLMREAGHAERLAAELESRLEGRWNQTPVRNPQSQTRNPT